MSTFDKKFGPDFLSTIPNEAGVYRFKNEAEKVIYVGKAKCLRRRLAQYRLASGKKKHRRMRRIVKDAFSLEFETCPSHLEACLLEVRLIQELQPKWNIASSYSFLYPYLGMREQRGELSFVFTTLPERAEGYTLFGAYRSREITGKAFFALMSLLNYIGHRSMEKKADRLGRAKYTYIQTFRQLPTEWVKIWRDFFRGVSRTALEELMLRLLEHAGARSKRDEVQQHVDALLEFWQLEALPLAKAISSLGYQGAYPIPQTERDPLFIRARLQNEA